MFGREPVAITAAIRAVILCAVLFGLDLSPAQITGIMLAVEAVLALLTRSQVSPEAAVNDLIRTAVSMPIGTKVATVKAEQAAKDEAK